MTTQKKAPAKKDTKEPEKVTYTKDGKEQSVASPEAKVRLEFAGWKVKG